MTKIYVQNSPCVWGTSTSMAANASQTSGSFYTQGFGRIVGTAWMSSSGTAACGVMVLQDGHDTDYDMSGSTVRNCYDVSALTTNSGSAFSYEIVGQRAEIRLHSGATDCASVRSAWFLKPVGSA